MVPLPPIRCPPLRDAKNLALRKKQNPRQKRYQVDELGDDKDVASASSRSNSTEYINDAPNT